MQVCGIVFNEGVGINFNGGKILRGIPGKDKGCELAKAQGVNKE